MRRRVATVALVVPDCDSAVAFNVGKIGLARVEDVDQKHKRRVPVAPLVAGPALLLSRADCPEQAAAIGNVGVTFEEAPRHGPYGNVAVWRDPFGNRRDLLRPR